MQLDGYEMTAAGIHDRLAAVARHRETPQLIDGPPNDQNKVNTGAHAAAGIISRASKLSTVARRTFSSCISILQPSCSALPIVLL